MSKKSGKSVEDSSDSETTIPILLQAVQELVSRRKKPEELEGIIAEAKALASEWKDPNSAKHPQNRRSLFDGTSIATNVLLAALVVVLRRDHEVLNRIRGHFSNKFETLCDETDWAELRAIAAHLPESALKPKQKYERKRRRWRRSFYNSIEYQFGGAAEAEYREFSLLPLGNSPYEPTCLDDIFAGETANMQRLEDLFFSIDRHRFSEALQGVQKRRYNYRAVAKIMEALLSEKTRKKRKGRGRSLRNPWLDDPNDPNRRRRVLNGIKARINRLSVEEDIRNTFLAVIQRHLPNSGKK